MLHEAFPSVSLVLSLQSVKLKSHCIWIVCSCLLVPSASSFNWVALRLTHALRTSLFRTCHRLNKDWPPQESASLDLRFWEPVSLEFLFKFLSLFGTYCSSVLQHILKVVAQRYTAFAMFASEYFLFHWLRSLIDMRAFREFVNNVWCIKILSPQEVQQMGKEGDDELMNSVPLIGLSNGTCDDYASRQDSRHMGNGMSSVVGSLDYWQGGIDISR